jgi:hypothetical protein
MFVAGVNRYTVESAFAALTKYADLHGATISAYDLGGPDEAEIDDIVSLTDIGRMVFINADLTGRDAASLVQFDLARRLDPLSIDLRLDQVDLHPVADDPRYAAMDDVWKALRLTKGIGYAKASKLLHLKRPKLFPIIDRHIRSVYKTAAKAEGRAVGSKEPHYWLAISADLQANSGELADLRMRLREEPVTRRLVYLTDLRIQDILAWRLGAS